MGQRRSLSTSKSRTMELYKASEGHAPKTHEEFMRSIVKANQIRLPTLPAGHRHVYDPENERLMVERAGE